MSALLKYWPALFLLFSLTGLSACKERGPKQSFRAFYAAVAKSDGDRAWSLLSHETQQAIQKFIDASTEAGVEAPSPQKMLVKGGYLRAVREIAEIEIINQARGRATLKVTDETGETQLVSLIKEGEDWRLLLPIPKS